MVDITFCMGSSCFSRGNEEALRVLEEYVERENLSDLISLKGEHCMGDCSRGPIISINGTRYSSLQPDGILEIVRHQLEEDK